MVRREYINSQIIVDNFFAHSWYCPPNVLLWIMVDDLTIIIFNESIDTSSYDLFDDDNDEILLTDALVLYTCKFQKIMKIKSRHSQ
jgi:hypothetical protein